MKWLLDPNSILKNDNISKNFLEGDLSKQGRETRQKLEKDDYVASEQSLHAVNAALLLGQPLLIAGEPGCGKTQLAYHVAARLGLNYADEVIRYDVKSDTSGKDLLYSYDALSHFHASYTRPNVPEPTEFVRFDGLGLAILGASEREDAEKMFGRWNRHTSPPKRSVVLIDEIDKAPRDVPNDLLREIETMQFRVTEVGPDCLVSGSQALRPIVFITSNAERALPDAFLRRCCYLHMTFPKDNQLKEIIYRRFSRLAPDSPLVRDLLHLFGLLRGPEYRLLKKPGTAELLSFLGILQRLEYDVDRGLGEIDNWEDIALSILSKHAEDWDVVTRLLSQAKFPAQPS